jgi:DNA-binding GntR family transcriptional regulator
MVEYRCGSPINWSGSIVTVSSTVEEQAFQAWVRTLRLAIRRYEHIYMADSGLIPTSAQQHRQIIAAFQHKDLEAGIQAIEENYRFGMQVLLRKMGEE